MKSTPFTARHIALGAKMAEFAGYNMPISYSGINDEHQAVRTNAGIFDVSHMGEFILKGEHALDLIQRVTTNDASKLTAGKAQYSALTNDKGGIVDDLLVYCLEENKAYMLVVNASNIEKDWKWISGHNIHHAEMHNISDRTCLLAIQGPNATKMLQPLTGIDILNMPYYTFAKGRICRGRQCDRQRHRVYRGRGCGDLFRGQGWRCRRHLGQAIRNGAPAGAQADRFGGQGHAASGNGLLSLWQ